MRVIRCPQARCKWRSARLPLTSELAARHWDSKQATRLYFGNYLLVLSVFVSTRDPSTSFATKFKRGNTAPTGSIPAFRYGLPSAACLPGKHATNANHCHRAQNLFPKYLFYLLQVPENEPRRIQRAQIVRATLQRLNTDSDLLSGRTLLTTGLVPSILIV